MWWGIVCFGGVAHAIDLDAWIPAWSVEFDGDQGSDGRDELLDVSIDQTQHVVVAGYVDGDPGLGPTALLATFERHDGTSAERPATSLWAPTTGSWPSTSRRATNELAFCGQRAGIDGPKPTDPVAAYIVDAREPNAYGIHDESSPLWDDAFELQPGSGGTQTCRGLDRAGLTRFTTGDAATPQGGRQWVTRLYDAATGALVGGAEFALAEPTALEQGEAIAGDGATGRYAVVGSSGASGADAQAIVRFVDADGTIRWSHGVPSPGSGGAAFHDVAYDVARGLVAAVPTVKVRSLRNAVVLLCMHASQPVVTSAQASTNRHGQTLKSRRRGHRLFRADFTTEDRFASPTLGSGPIR